MWVGSNMCSSVAEHVFGVKECWLYAGTLAPCCCASAIERCPAGPPPPDGHRQRDAGLVLRRRRHRDHRPGGGRARWPSLSEGATVIDVGGMTARPGVVLSAADEIARVLPVLEGIRAAGCEAVISVDTYRADVAAAALDAGADMINDHTGLTDASTGGGRRRARRRAGRHAPGARAEAGAGRPLRDRRRPRSPRFLSQRAELAVDAGIDRDGARARSRARASASRPPPTWPACARCRELLAARLSRCCWPARTRR